MQRPCDVCGTLYEAKRATSKVCSSGCRVRKARAAGGKVGPQSVAETLTLRRESGLRAALEAELAAAGRLETSRGQLVLMLADRIGAPMDTGASVASMSKELRSAMDAAMAGVKVAADPLDELRARRAAKSAG